MAGQGIQNTEHIIVAKIFEYFQEGKQVTIGIVNIRVVLPINNILPFVE